jgi:hypothetical protein
LSTRLLSWLTKRHPIGWSVSLTRLH